MARRRVVPASFSSVAWSAFHLAAEAQAVVALRMFRMATSRSPAREFARMISEKVETALSAQQTATVAVATGRPEVAASRVLGVYRRKVKATNRQRLTR